MRSSKQHGFVLVLTLWVLVVVAIAAGYFADRVSLAVSQAQQARQNTQAAVDMASTRAEVLFRLGTTTLTEYGLGRGAPTVFLDNRAYHGDGDTVIQLQDTRGLINLNLADDGMLNRFLGLLNIEPDQRSRMIDTLRDYTSASKFRRLNGAKEDEYRAAGLPPPYNRELVSPWQAQRILGWRDTPQLWLNNQLPNYTATSQSMGLNPNTAPPEVLATLPGVTLDLAQLIVAQRALAPFTHEGQITRLTTVPLNLPMGMGIIAIPSDTLRVTQSTVGQPWALQYTVKLTPNNPNAPWRIDYYGRVSQPDVPNAAPPAAQSAAQPPGLPPRSDAPPDKFPAFLMGL